MLNDEIFHECARCGSYPTLASLWRRLLGEGQTLQPVQTANGIVWLCVNCCADHQAGASCSTGALR